MKEDSYSADTPSTIVDDVDMRFIFDEVTNIGWPIEKLDMVDYYDQAGEVCDEQVIIRVHVVESIKGAVQPITMGRIVPYFYGSSKELRRYLIDQVDGLLSDYYDDLEFNPNRDA